MSLVYYLPSVSYGSFEFLLIQILPCIKSIELRVIGHKEYGGPEAASIHPRAKADDGMRIVGTEPHKSPSVASIGSAGNAGLESFWGLGPGYTAVLKADQLSQCCCIDNAVVHTTKAHKIGPCCEMLAISPWLSMPYQITP